MKTNIGNVERLARIILGGVILGSGVMYQTWWGVIGAVPLLTGLLGWCPPYAMFGINTCKTPKAD
jgi:hypothetical protein